MKKAVLYALLVAIALVAVVLGFAASQPDAWSVERSVEIQAPRRLVYQLVDDLHRYDEWSPFLEYDPHSRRTIEGQAGSTGQTYAWDGDDKVGSGKMTITDLKVDERVDVALEFVKPMPSRAQVAWLLAEVPAGTKLTWTMNGSYEGAVGLVGKAMGLLMSMDKMVGADFERGLAKAKAICEREAAAPH